MNKFNWLWSHPNLFLMLMAVIGYAVAVSLNILSPYLLWSTWELALRPPPKATQILGYDHSGLYVQAEDGLPYSCDIMRRTCKEFSTPIILNPNPYVPDCPASIPPTIPILVDNIIDTFAQRMCGYHGYYVDINIIALDDGSVWIGRRYGDFFENGTQQLILMYVRGYIGAWGGIFLGILLKAVAWMVAN